MTLHQGIGGVIRNSNQRSYSVVCLKHLQQRISTRKGANVNLSEACARIQDRIVDIRIPEEYFTSASQLQILKQFEVYEMHSYAHYVDIVFHGVLKALVCLGVIAICLFARLSPISEGPLESAFSLHFAWPQSCRFL